VVGRVWSYRDITDRKHAEKNLVASLQEKDVLLREIHHRVKNNLQLISGLLDMTRMGSTDESTISILTDMMLRIQTMAQIHTRLYESEQIGKISLSAQIQNQIDGLSTIYSNKGQEIRCEVHSDDVFLPVDQAIPCGLAVNEILSNAYKHAFTRRKKGVIRISVLQENGRITIAVHDDGIGLPADFDINRTKTLGIQLIRTLVQHQLKGSLTVKSGKGTEIRMEFPAPISGA
jgi:two-component sensor histidine kinase